MLAESLTCDAVDLDQNWSADQLSRWYESTQGSRLIPLSWFVALEQANSTDLFLVDSNVRKFGYELRMLTASNTRLPRGFVIDRTDDKPLQRTKLRWRAGQGSREPWVGMNCSACHTAAIQHEGTSLTVIGGPTNADLQSFLEALDASLQQTSSDPVKFARFAPRVLAENDSQQNRALLATALSTLVKQELEFQALNATDLRYGFGRLDAVGHILNKVQILTGAPSPPAHPADAPVSYPYLWNVPQQDKLQWNGIAENQRLPAVGGEGLDIGALGRNTGELIGVFGDVVVVKNPGKFTGFKSSLNASNMVGLEDQLRHLRPPLWPADLLGPPDAAAVTDGTALFKEHCQRCHQLLPRNDLETKVSAKMVKLVQDGNESAIGTDLWMACNAYYAHGPTGLLEGLPEVQGTGDVGTDDKLANLLAVNVKQVLLGQKYKVGALIAVGYFGVEPTPEPAAIPGYQVWLDFRVAKPSDKEIREKVCRTTADPLLAYKGRSLNGIWATSPYLHNGSVPSLYDLLLPPQQRPTQFYTGSTEFDPKRVGFVTGPGGDNKFLFDTSKSGNSNQGHDYAASALNDTQRRALIEYMKTL